MMRAFIFISFWAFMFLCSRNASGDGSDKAFNEILERSTQKGKEMRRKVAIERKRLVEETRLLICDSENFQYLECEYDSSGNLIYSGGMFGIGIRVFIYPTHSDVVVYKNCRIELEDEKLKCDYKNLINSSTPIRLFMKKENSKLGHQYRYSYKKIKDPLLMESYLTSYFANILIDGLPISPMVYSVFDPRTNLPVPSLSRYILIEFIDGFTIAALLKKFKEDETRIISHSLLRLLSAYNETLLANEKVRSVQRRKEYIFRMTMNRAIGEIFVRLRYRVTLIDAVLNFMQRVWERFLYHCDLFQPNIMILAKKIQDPRELKEIMLTGSGVIVDRDTGFNFMDEEVLDSQIAKYIAANNGASVIQFNRASMRLIDLSFAMDLNLELDQKTSKILDVETPCRIYRPDRREDLVELRRLIDDALYINAKTGETAFFSNWLQIKDAISKGRFQSKSYKDVGNLLNRFFDEDPNVKAYADHFTQAMETAQSYFYDLRTSLYKGEWDDCYANHLEWRRYKLVEKKDFMKRHLLKFKNPCNVKTMAVATYKARHNLARFADHLQQHVLRNILLNATTSMTSLYGVKVAPQYEDRTIKILKKETKILN